MLAEPHYEPHVVSPNGGGIVNSFGMIVQTERAGDAALDTLIVGSPPDTRKPPDDVVQFLQDSFRRARLDGRRSTTHWMFGDELKRRFPKTRVDIDRIFVQDGPIWTSAGMTAGIDLALSLIEGDLGSDKAREAARNMVIHHRRAGGQSQHSALLTLDAKSDRVQDALQYARRNLSKPLSVEKLAQAACLSPRQFSRVFRLETGMSPAKAVENLRLESARFMLEQGRLPVETIARINGFRERERMRRSFLRTYGQTAQSIRNASRPLVSI